MYHDNFFFKCCFEIIVKLLIELPESNVCSFTRNTSEEIKIRKKIRLGCLFENYLQLILRTLRNIEQLRKESEYKGLCSNCGVELKGAHTEFPIYRILKSKLKSECIYCIRLLCNIIFCTNKIPKKLSDIFKVFYVHTFIDTKPVIIIHSLHNTQLTN